jgi:uncharacterized protein involved in exopolysaccharide biosynthesis
MSDQTTSGLMDQIHQLKQQLATARAARDAVARDYQAASRGEEAARQQLAEAEKRGAVKALALIEAQYGDERAGELTVRGNVQMAAHDLARRIESGEVTA